MPVKTFAAALLLALPAASEPFPPGREKRIPITNMTVGAVPDHVKLQAAFYADGTSSAAASAWKPSVS